jgi:hypothetical protein
MIILAAFCAVSLAVCTHTPVLEPDEVQYLDPVANWYFGQGFTSPLWGQDWRELCVTYVPLYDGLLMAVFKLAGFGFFQARAFAPLLAAGGSCLIWRGVARLGLIQQPGYRLLCLALTLSGCASTLAFRHLRPDSLMFVVAAALFYACSLRQHPRLQLALVFAASLPLAAAGVALVPYVGTIALCYLIAFQGRNFRLLLALAAGTVAGMGLLAGFLKYTGNLEKYVNFLVLPQTVAGTGVNSRFWHDKIFGDGPLDNNMFNIFFGRPGDFLGYKTLFDYSGFLLFLLSVAVAVKIWKKTDTTTRRLTLVILPVVLIVPPLLNVASHFAYYYRWMPYMPAAILAARLLDVSKSLLTAPVRWLGCLLVATAIGFGVPGRTVSVLPTWKQRSPAPVEQALKSVARPEDIAICDYKVYFAARPYVKRIFACGVTAYGDFRFVKNLPTNDISLLALSAKEVPVVTGRIGGQWEKLPAESVAGMAALDGNRYQVEFYRRTRGEKKI